MELDVRLMDIDYVIEDGEAAIRFYAKSDGKNVLVRDEDFLPYFYAVPEEESTEEAMEAIETGDFSHEDDSLEVRKVENDTKTDSNEEREVIKVYTDVPPNVPKLKSELEELPQVDECREFDIPFYKRYLIDNGIQPTKPFNVKGEEFEDENFDTALKAEKIDTTQEKEPEWSDWNVLAFDLEVYEDEIVMASFAAEGFEKLLTTADIDREFSEQLESEKELLERFMEIIEERDTDVLLGYNTDEFDFDVLRDRCQENGLELTLGRNGERMKFERRGRFSSARLKGRMHLDLYPFVTHVLAPGLDSERLDLDSVAEEMLGENKDDMSWEEMKESWSEKENLEEFADYALKDAELALGLGNEIAPQILELSRLTTLIPFDACRLTYGQLTENFLLKEAYEQNILAANRPTRSERRKRQRKGAYSGGFVYTPEPGLHENIVLFDFKSLYPTVMVAHNISPDTLDLESCSERFEVEEFGYDFCQDDQGFFPELVERLVRDRSQIKEEMAEKDEEAKEYKSLYNRQAAEKYLANSFYGYLGYNGARWYSRECAEATTYLGRKYIQDTIEIAEERGLEVVYGDTDSVFLKGENIRDEMDAFLKDANSELPEFMELEFEGFFTRGFFTSTDSGEGAKKKYALLDEEGGMKITGFEQVRRDWSPVAKQTQKEVLRKVLENDISDAADTVRETVERLRNGEVPVEELRIYTTLTKDPEEYESTSPHVEAVKKARQRGEDISTGETIAYVITRGSGSISSRAELPKYAGSYDADYYIENQVIPATLRVLKVFDYTEGQLKGEGRQSGLGRFG